MPQATLVAEKAVWQAPAVVGVPQVAAKTEALLIRPLGPERANKAFQKSWQPAELEVAEAQELFIELRAAIQPAEREVGAIAPAGISVVTAGGV